MACPRCRAEHEQVWTTASMSGAFPSGAPQPDEWECLRAANRRIDALEKALVELARTAAIAGAPVSSIVGG